MTDAPRRQFHVCEVTADHGPEIGVVCVVARTVYATGELGVIDNLRRFPLEPMASRRPLGRPKPYGTPERRSPRRRR